MARVLVIAIGNPLRSDDGLAWRAVDALEDAASPRPEILRVQQLTPELAESIRDAQRVIFVDAARDREPGTLSFEKLGAMQLQARFTHHLTPSSLIAMAHGLYNAAPEAFLVTLAGESFAHGEMLSAVVERELPQVVEKIRELMAK